MFYTLPLDALDAPARRACGRLARAPRALLGAVLGATHGAAGAADDRLALAAPEEILELALQVLPEVIRLTGVLGHSPSCLRTTKIL